MFEKSNVKVDLVREGFLNWSEHSVTPGQLFTWRWGHGLSLPGGGDEMSFQLGLVHLALAGIGLVAAWRSDDSTRRRELFAFAFLAAMGAWLATTLASPVWSRVQTLQFMAYPWRALLLPALFVPLLVSRGCERLGLRWSTTALAFLVLVNLPHTEPRGYRPIADEEWSADQIAKRGVNTTTREEYEPRWVESRPPYSAVRLRAMQGTGVVVASVIESDYQRLELSLTQDGTVEAATFHYPGWRVLVDGELVSHEVVPGRGTMAFETTAGDHVVEIELGTTSLRRAANVASLTVVFGLLIGVVRERRRRPRKLR